MPGPFSYRDYVLATQAKDFYCDEVMLAAFLWETKLTCMIVMSPSLVLYNVTEFYSLQDADLVLVFNGYDQFTAARKCYADVVSSS